MDKKKIEREQTTIRLPKELLDKLKGQADRMGISVSSVILICANEARSLQEKSCRANSQNS